MGHIYALCGPSAVGKTTFLNELFSTHQTALDLLVRATGRKKRPNERESVDYHFYSKEGFLHKIFSNDFIHVEQYSNNFYGVESIQIEDTIKSENDGIIMAGIYGATRLKTIYKGNVSIIYMYSGDRQSLLNPTCLNINCIELSEIKRRLHEKIEKELVHISKADIPSYVENRMELNLLELAYVNGRIRSGENIIVLSNYRDKLANTISTFNEFRAKTTGIIFNDYSKTNICFVLMPFKEILRPVYEDHISKVVRRIGLECLRADKIFSNRPIVDDVLDAVRNARIVISDLTENNPNVFYETGYCHALGKEVILVTQNDEVPFDLRHIRQIRYEYTPRGMQNFESALENTIKSILVT